MCAEVVMVVCNSELKYFDLYIPDPGIAYLASAVKKNGYKFTFFDLNQLDITPQHVLKYVEKNKPEIIGFKLWVDGFITLKKLAQECKSISPRSLTVGGGPHVRLFREAILNVTGAFDIICYSEGDATIVELLEYVEGRRPLAEVNNLHYRENGHIKTTPQKLIADLDQLPRPDWDIIERTRYFPIFLINMLRGCPFQCTFCCHNYLWGMPFQQHELKDKTHKELLKMRIIRRKSFENVRSELEFLIKTYGIRIFNLIDSTPSIKHLKQLCDWLIDSQLETHWVSFGRVKYFNQDLMKKLKQAGWMGLFYGIESGSPRILKAMGKTYSKEDIVESIQIAKENNIDIVTGSFVVGFPGEDEASLKETRDLIDELELDAVLISPFTLEPGSPVALKPGSYGIDLHADWQEKMIEIPEGGEWHEAHCYEIDGMPNTKWWSRFEHFSGYQGRNMDRQVAEYDVANMLAPYLGLTGSQFMEKIDHILKRKDVKSLRDLEEQAWKNATF